VVLPASLPQGPYRDALTGCVIEPDAQAGPASLRLSRAFANLPVAVLEPA
jgi:hypothetical protein